MEDRVQVNVPLTWRATPLSEGVWRFRFKVRRIEIVNRGDGGGEVREGQDVQGPWSPDLQALAEAEGREVARAEVERTIAAGAEEDRLRARVSRLQRALGKERRMRREAQEVQEGAEARAVVAEERVVEAEERQAEAEEEADKYAERARMWARAAWEEQERRMEAEAEVARGRAARAAAVAAAEPLIQID